MKSLLQKQTQKTIRDQSYTELPQTSSVSARNDWSWRAVIFGKPPRTLGSISNPFRMHTNSQPHSQLMAITIKVLKEQNKTNNFEPNCFWSLYIFDDFRNNDTNTNCIIFRRYIFVRNSGKAAEMSKCSANYRTRYNQPVVFWSLHRFYSF